MKRLAIIIMIILASATYADYHYASHEGSNEYPYSSWATATDSIQLAIDAAEAGDTVYVGAGIWEQHDIYLWDSLALIGMGIDSTIIQNSTHVNYIWMFDNSLVTGLTFNSLNYNLGRGIEIDFHEGITIKNNKFCNLHNGIQAVFHGVIDCNIFDSNGTAIDASFSFSSGIARNNTFYNCDEMAVNIRTGNWLFTNNLVHHNPDGEMYSVIRFYMLYETDSAYIANNLFYRNLEDNNDYQYSPLKAGPKAFVENNTIIGFDEADQNSGLSMSSWYDSASVNARNNIISGFEYAIRFSQSFGMYIGLYYNCLWNNQNDHGYNVPSFEEGNIWEDPMFADTTSFMLQAYSPCIDAGDPDVLDVDGTRSDIGCYGGPGGCSYTYLDLAPKIPDSIAVDVDTSGVTLSWRSFTEADFNRYQIYRSTIGGFEPDISDIIGEPDTSYYHDTDILPGFSYYYRLTSVDNQGNISDYSDEVAVLPDFIPGADSEALPRYTVIERAYPNPSNSNVTIVYSASNIGPQPPKIELKIFDITGRLVKTLVDERKPAGTYRAVWDGRSDTGWPVASGTYIARVYQWDCPGGDFPVKITLIK